MLFLSVIDNNASNFFWYLYLLSWVTFCLFLSLIERSVNFTASTQLRGEYISQSYSLEEYTVVLFVILSKIVLLNLFDRGERQRSTFNLKNNLQEKKWQRVLL